MVKRHYRRIEYEPLQRYNRSEKLKEEERRFREKEGIPGRVTARAVLTGRATNVGRRVSHSIFSGLRGASRFASQTSNRRFTSGNSYGRGRPKGSYDPRYAKYGGVYGYRKMLNAQLRERKLRLQQQLSMSPRQRQILNQVQANENAQRVNPENQPIPDTTGKVNTRSIHQEIEDASNIVP